MMLTIELAVYIQDIVRFAGIYSENEEPDCNGGRAG